MSRINLPLSALLLAVFALFLAEVVEVPAARVPDVRSTPHNLSITGPGPVKSTSETQVCVFCHTPHGAENVPGAPLWNRKLSTATYTPYSSSSIEASVAEMAAAPGGSSKLCLSCHDGAMAIGSVNVLNGVGPASIGMTGTAGGGVMPPGSGLATGFTRNLGADLGNDHPISLTYDAALAANDGELRTPDGTNVGSRTAGVRPAPKLPLEGGQVQCATCHDPHLNETDPAKQPGKFLRANRLQETAPGGGTFNENNDQICIACHDKAGQAWANSAHANPLVADETYKAAAASQREFPANLPVWRAACLNCHDTHSVQGSRRLLREGTDSTATPKSGGGSAIEETCYQCHSNSAQSILNSVTQVPNIKDDFALARRMPINSADQGGTEVHDIGTANSDAPTRRGKDFIESRSLLGIGNAGNRHAECTDCHNPHRVTRNKVFNANAATPDADGTHNIGSNLASGVLRGTWGVEPNYGSASFHSLPTSYSMKRGDPGNSADTAKTASYVTREYQICLKCHSDYGYDDNNVYPNGTRPSLGYLGGTPFGTNGLTQYTNQAKEFQAPLTHQGNAVTNDSGAFAGDPPGTVANVNFQTNNRRSWHPVVDATGRSHALRNTSAASFLAPWQNNVGSQTMYCSDCHGSSTGATTITPTGANPWGPHGSSNNFILKGAWSQATGSGGAADANGLCFKCHTQATYAGTSGGGTTGFFNNDKDNLHQYHRDKIGRIRCTWCHVAVPHGWKNKALLVNLNDVGAEAGLPAGTQVRNNTTAGYTSAPYYLNAILKVRTFAPSGNWQENSCGSVGAPGNGQSGRDWMRDGSENCDNPP
jgi:hypothetical protein